MVQARTDEELVSQTQLSEPCVAGTIVIYHRSALESLCGREVVTQALARLSAAERQEILDALPVSWVRHATLEVLYDQTARLARRDVADLHAQIVRRGIEHRVRHLWRILIRLSGPAALATRAKMIYEKSYSVGRININPRGPGSTDLVLQGWPGVPEMAIRGVRVGTHTLLTLSGFKDPHVIVQTQDEGAVFRLTWSV
jgi:hypothetical protein